MHSIQNEEARSAMSDRQAKIQKMIEMQKVFSDYERKNGVTQQEYYAADEKHPLHDYRKEYAALAEEVLEMAHADKGSSRF